MEINSKQAFTLVELIVVITILAILGTIAFISLQGYSASSRDSVRISDVSNMKTSLELFHLNVGKYPLPDDAEEVLYDSQTLWYQGTFGSTVVSQLSRNINKIPKDSLSNKEYIYSVVNNKNEFQILNLLEGDLVLNTINQTNAANSTRIPRVDGQFNGVFIKTAGYIVPTPSIITAENVIGGLTLNETNIKSQIITGGKNIPNIGNVNTATGQLIGLKLSVYTGSVISTDNNTKKEEIMKLIQAAYTDSELANNDIYTYILSKTSTNDLVALIDTLILNVTNTNTSSIITQINKQKNISLSNASDWEKEDSINGTNIIDGKIISNFIISEVDLTSPTNVSSSCQYSGSYGPGRAVDNIWDEYNSGWICNIDNNLWISFDFGSNKKINKLRFKADMSYPTVSMKNYIIQSSNDNINWIDQYTGIGQPDNTIIQEATFEHSDLFRYWRIYIIDNCGYASRTQTAEIELIENSKLYITTQPYYINTSNTNQLNLSTVSKISSVNITNIQPALTSIKSLVSFDGRNTWKKWNGAIWINHIGGLDNLQAGNTIEQIQAGLTNFIINTESTLDFAFDLSTNDSSVTPEISGININYIE